MELPPKVGIGTLKEKAENSSELTEKEIKALREGYRLVMPRREYAEGKQRLDFHHTFSTGEILSATEDEEGIATIVIKNGREIVFNFQDLLPTQFYKFVTPRMYPWAKRTDSGEWTNEQFTVHIGDMTDPKSIALLLHEIGHILDYKSRDGKYKNRDTRDLWRMYTGLSTKGLKNERIELAEEISIEERNAWANALKIIRKVKQEKRIDLLEPFGNLEELREVIYAGLLKYRTTIKDDIISSDEGIIKDISMKILEKLGFSKGEYGMTQEKFVERLFDKNRLKRGA